MAFYAEFSLFIASQITRSLLIGALSFWVWWKEAVVVFSYSMAQIARDSTFSNPVGTRVLNIKPGTVILYDKISLYFNLNNIGYTRLMVKQAGEIIPKKRTCKVDL